MLSNVMTCSMFSLAVQRVARVAHLFYDEPSLALASMSLL